MTPKEEYKFVVKILWWLKVPEVLATIVMFGGLLIAVIGLIPISVPLFAFCIRVILFPLRIMIIREKRKMEKTFPISTKKVSYGYKRK